jgi:hypothetical protein
MNRQSLSRHYNRTRLSKFQTMRNPFSSSRRPINFVGAYATMTARESDLEATTAGFSEAAICNIAGHEQIYDHGSFSIHSH